jgi:subtilisin family serine protease
MRIRPDGPRDEGSGSATARMPDPMAGRPRSASLPRSPARAQIRRPAPADAGPATTPPLLPDAIPGEFVLRFASSFDQEQFMRAARAAGGAVLGQIAFGHAVRVKVRDRAALDEILRQTPTPTDISHNYFMRTPAPQAAPGPQAPEEGYWGFEDKSLAWLGVRDNDRWGFGVMVAVLDTGVLSHPALDEARISRIDLLPEDPNHANPHGTAVASLIAGTTEELAGVAPQTSVLSVRVMNADGTGNAFTIAQGILEAVDRGARVINLCLGSHGDSPLFRDAVAFAQEHGAVVVAATGNDAEEGVLFPAAYDGVVAVAGVDAAGRHLYFSNRGASVDLSAPGIEVAAATTNGGTARFSGTSAAAPFVSGAVAGLLSSNPGMSGARAVEILVRNADDAGPAGPDGEYGAGILDMRRVADRDTAGLYDMAAADATLRSDAAGNLVVTFTAQNRGTEDLRGVAMDITAPGARQSAYFESVRVGQTISYDAIVSRVDIERGGQLSLQWSVQLRNAADSRPENNTRTLTLAVPARSS